MKKILSAAALGAAMTIAGAALANDTLEATFGNTVSGALADGTVVVSYHMRSDNTFSITSAEGTVDGTWRTEADQVCLTVAGGEEGCSALVDGIGVGGSQLSWSSLAAAGPHTASKATSAIATLSIRLFEFFRMSIIAGPFRFETSYRRRYESGFSYRTFARVNFQCVTRPVLI